MFIVNTNIIKEKLDNKNMTQGQLSELLNIDPATLSYIINNKGKTLNLEIAYKICNLLNLKIEDIIIDNIKIHSPQNSFNELLYHIEKLYKTSKSIDLSNESFYYKNTNNSDYLSIVAERESEYRTKELLEKFSQLKELLLCTDSEDNFETTLYNKRLRRDLIMELNELINELSKK